MAEFDVDEFIRMMLERQAGRLRGQTQVGRVGQPSQVIDPAQAVADAAVENPYAGFDTGGIPVTPGPSQPAQSMEARSTDALQEQLRQRKNTASLLGEDVPERDPGLLNRIFDVLQRGQYATASADQYVEAAKREGEPIWRRGDDALKGAIEGVTGRNKRTWGENVEEQMPDAPHALKVALGFGGDVFLDPTTYIGGGVVKKAGKEVAAKAAREAQQEAMQSPVVQDRIRQLANDAVRQATKKNKGKILPKKTTDTIRREAIRQAPKVDEDIVGMLSQAAKEATEAAIEANPGRVQFKAFGREIGTGKGVGKSLAEKVYSAGAQTGAKVAGTKYGGALNEAFRPMATYPGRLNFLKRKNEGLGVALWEKDVSDIRRTYKDLTADEAKRISHAIERGEDLSGILTKKSGRDLEEVKREFQQRFDDIWAKEVEDMGLHGDDEKLHGYVYHILRNKNSDAYAPFKKRRKNMSKITENPNFEKHRVLGSLAEAKELGLNPVEDIRSILEHRLYKHYQTASRKDFVRAAAADFGTTKNATVAKRLGLEKVQSRFLPDEVYVEPKIARAVNGIEELFEDEGKAQALMDFYNKVHNQWKTAATVWNPGHHFRNIMGDLFLNYEDGVTDPRVYKKAFDIAFSRNNPSAEVNNKVGKLKLSNLELDTLYRTQGLKSGFFRTEFGEGKGFKRYGARTPTETLRKVSEAREDAVRMAHFIDALADESRKYAKKADLSRGSGNYLKARNQIAEKAAQRVRKFNFDYGDFTDFEQKKVKKIIPFYSWLRKNLPLQVEMLATRPGRIAAIPKTQRAIQEMLGVEEQDAKLEETIPQWLREEGAMRLTNGENPTYIAPGIPFNDIGQWDPSKGGTELLRNLVSSTGPGIRMPFEMVAGEKFFSGAPTEASPKYFSEQIPLGRLGYRALTEDDSTGSTALNWATGLGIRNVSEGTKQGELRRQQDIIDAIVQAAKEKQRGELGV